MAIPSKNNVFGYFFAPEGLEPIVQALKAKFADHISMNSSQADFTGTVRLASDSYEFDSTATQNDCHLFNGAVSGSVPEISEIVKEISAALAAAGISHQLEVYDEKENPAGSFPG